jgi:hypothetical protein
LYIQINIQTLKKKRIRRRIVPVVRNVVNISQQVAPSLDSLLGGKRSKRNSSSGEARERLGDGEENDDDDDGDDDETNQVGARRTRLLGVGDVDAFQPLEGEDSDDSYENSNEDSGGPSDEEEEEEEEGDEQSRSSQPNPALYASV